MSEKFPGGIEEFFEKEILNQLAYQVEAALDRWRRNDPEEWSLLARGFQKYNLYEPTTTIQLLILLFRPIIAAHYRIHGLELDEQIRRQRELRPEDFLKSMDALLYDINVKFKKNQLLKEANRGRTRQEKGRPRIIRGHRWSRRPPAVSTLHARTVRASPEAG